MHDVVEWAAAVSRPAAVRGTAATAAPRRKAADRRWKDDGEMQCRKERASPPWPGPRACRLPSHRHDAHSAAPPSAFSRYFSMDGEGVSAT